ncbi:MAG: 16S rRNA (cytosine(1402)-N(4))-methyltransferase RsmH [Muribaculaceae bacterium]|jgi:16S rRNA (cytosine1402-N4)-methyltransferase|nr:16S rRNA (cytosine(1402)-N(4))-methyltransferase RsmH [Muribaculaceae bacterium]MBQ2370607.1 16S rRNA (cytosine(1402)-N(4))-methyltransferase RsmH [Muribaculaceae bacterium]MBQ2399792.1 16S rRNA (cytosine(1402)-N(4))-methyltransferase RsmH [Muribaculaceae bacterium]
MEKPVYHIPAMLQECIDGLQISPSGTYVDVTFGGGGHSRGIIEQLGEGGRLFSFDQDLDAYANRIEDPRFTFVHSNFRYLTNFMRFHKVDKVDGILGDLGVSFHHFDEAERGFSFRADAPLDMRMNRSARVDAAQVVNTYTEEQLLRIMADYGDMRRPMPIVRAILKARDNKPVMTTGQLLDVIRPLINPKQEKKELAQIFQALRIEVNGEMDALKRFLESTLEVLRPGGRLVVLTYHSLEDRMVKNFIKTGNTEGIVDKDFFGKVNTPWRQITKGAVAPSQEEIDRNPRSRSAKLRVAELIVNE